jgi:crotonobetainyl-CoA:carnitine CoA-transferase CaiB-like acyl-CoA transferase
VGALDGIRVVETATLLAGPLCGQLLGDLGAEVTKVEPPGGEPGRTFGEGEAVVAFFAAVNRGKRGVVLDLRDPDDLARLGALIADADVLVENFLPAFRERVGLTDDWLAQRNPGLIHCAVSGFGSVGPDANRPATDVVLQALSGLALASGQDGDPPIKVGFPLGDMTTGLVCALGVMVALRERDADPLRRGRVVTASILESLLTLQAPLVALADVLGRQPERLGSANPFNAPVQLFATADGHIAVSAFTDKFWTRLARAIGRDELLTDPRFTTNADRLARRDTLALELAPTFADATTAHWLERLLAADVPTAPVNTYAEALASPQVAALDLLRATRAADGRSVTTVGVPFSVDGRRPSATTPDLPAIPMDH